MFIFNFIAEGTTTNGDYLLPFKTGAFLARAPVLPVILRYPYQRFSPAWDSISGVMLLKQLLHHGFLTISYNESWFVPFYLDFWTLKSWNGGCKLPNMVWLHFVLQNHQRYTLIFQGFGHLIVPWHMGPSVPDW